MVIPEAQLTTWSARGSVAGSATAYASVTNAVDVSGLKKLHGIDVFLQGSYRNATNIPKESDVDVVVNCHDTFHSYKGLLAGVELAKANAMPVETYTWNEFRADVRAALVSYYGAGRVKDKNKCLQVLNAGGTGISADVVPAFDYRYYYGDAAKWLEGIAFFTKASELIVGFPEYHYASGVLKNDATKQEFKPSARVFKNAGAEMVDRRLMNDGSAPSYFIECLIYNVPDDCFVAATWQDQTAAIFNWLATTDKSGFKCVNGVYQLFGAGQWTMAMADFFLDRFRYLWNNW
jgi:hypothetical protein